MDAFNAHQWRCSEWSDDVFVAYIEGYELSVEPAASGFTWMVRATAEISETPEIYGLGETLTFGLAQHDAFQAVTVAIEGVAA